MDFYEAVEKRRTVRDFSPKPVPRDTVERILAAGMRAPSNDHMRNWEFVVMTDREKIAEVVKKIPKKVSDKRLDFIMKSMKFQNELQLEMYRDAIPKQYAMLTASGCLILPFFREKGDLLKPKSLSSLNAFASIWCCIENIFLATAAEGLACAMRIPFAAENEHIREVLSAPADYVMPCFIALGYPAETAVKCRQIEFDTAEKIHYNEGF
jgi:nitroreductase